MSHTSTQPISWLYKLGWALLPRTLYDALQVEIVRQGNELANSQTELETLRQRIEELGPKKVATPTVPMRNSGEILTELQKYAFFGDMGDVKRLKKELLNNYPEKEAEADKKIATGKDSKVMMDKLYEAALQHGEKSQETQALRQEFCRRYSFLSKKADEQINRGEMARQRRQQTDERKKHGKLSAVLPRQQPQTPVTAPHIAPILQPLTPIPDMPLHAQDIRGVKPSPCWSLVIDEAGKNFTEEAQYLSEGHSDLGRWVGLLVPENGHCLPKLDAGWHAVTSGLDEIDRVVQCVLDANVGAFGLTVQQLPLSTGERWATGVLSLINWVIRLIPLDGRTTIHVQIESRGIFTKQMEWPALAFDALRRLALAYPERASLIELDIQVIDKVGSPFNGYVDALAFTWDSPNEASQARLKATQLVGTCFLEGNAEQILRAWEWLDRGINILPDDWSQLLTQPDVKVAGGLITTILQRLGEECKNNAVLWRTYIDETRQHLDSKAIHLTALSRQIDWLEKYRPINEKIPSRLRLLWLTTRLACANHLGETEHNWMAEMLELGVRLMEEDAPLVCWADLHLAVNATNRYDFAQASNCLERWRDVPRSVPGLRYWAQAHSSLGQHAAFVDDYERAREYFAKALDAFGKLSDEQQRHKEITQTATYRAIVEVDFGDDISAREAVESVIGSLPSSIDWLAPNASEGDKYRHHLLLRWLVYRGSEAERQRYLDQRELWQVGYGHPWPLIQLYRGILLAATNKEDARSLALEGYTLAMDSQQGPTLRLIGACCRAVSAAWGEAWPEGEVLLGELEQQLPTAKPHIDALRAYLASPNDIPLQVVRRVLPFNFH